MSGVADPVVRTGLTLQSRLLVTVLGLMAAVWLAVAASIWYDTGHELDELLDAHLAQAAALLATQRLDDLEGDNFPPPPNLHKYQSRVAIQVWHAGHLMVRSTNAPDVPLADHGKPGLTNQEVDGQAWRVLTTAGNEPHVVIHVGELAAARKHILLASLRSVIWPMLLALPLLALGIWWAVRGAVRPLRQLGQAVAARRPESLAPLSSTAVPPEVAPLVDALNGLLSGWPLCWSPSAASRRMLRTSCARPLLRSACRCRWPKARAPVLNRRRRLPPRCRGVTARRAWWSSCCNSRGWRARPRGAGCRTAGPAQVRTGPPISQPWPAACWPTWRHRRKHAGRP